jgi:hypothetical protein
MNGKLLHDAQRLQRALQSFKPDEDRDTLVWAHGFLTAIVKNIEAQVPDLMTTSIVLDETRAQLDELLRKAGERSVIAKRDLDSLEEIQENLDDPDGSPVPVKLKPGPKGRSGGATAPLPESDLPM